MDYKINVKGEDFEYWIRDISKEWKKYSTLVGKDNYINEAVFLNSLPSANYTGILPSFTI